MSRFSIYQIDAFANGPFSGNPAAVVPLTSEMPDAWMQSVGNEMNLAETAFVRPLKDDLWSLRWFTPTVEVSLCGHATLATAHVLWETGRLSPDKPARFETRSGILECVKDGEHIVMDFPALPVERTEPTEALRRALADNPIVAAGRSSMGWLVELESEEALRAFRPSMEAVTSAGTEDTGLIVTAKGSGEYDVVSRFFAPQSGVPEDHVTGSAHCALAHHWAARTNKTSFRAFQASPRGGEVGMALRGDRVDLRGRAVTVMRGDLLV